MRKFVDFISKICDMLDIERFIAKNVTGREESFFVHDLEAHSAQIRSEIAGKKVCVIGGAGSIGSAYIKELVKFGPASLTVIDLSENGLAELTRDLRSTAGLTMPEEYRTYAISFADSIFARIFREEKGFDIVANFSAHKHVRSEKDKYAVQALLENNDIKAAGLMDLLSEFPPKHFFCVSTDKAANPVNVMGASKRIMEDIIMAYKDRFKVTTARFANVAFSNGSLPDAWIQRLRRRQPLAAPKDVKRYFVSPSESGQICLMACILGKSGEIFFPRLKESQMKTFSEICDAFLVENGLVKKEFSSDASARAFAAAMPEGSREYPVVYSLSDTTGEKDFEEFYVPGEKLDLERFASLGVILESPHKSAPEVKAFLEKLETLFANPAFTKEEVVDAIRGFVPNFVHEEKGKNLDQKM